MLKRYTRPNPVRRTLRRGEPTPLQKAADRLTAFERAKGFCQIRRPGCLGWVPLDGPDEFSHGHLAHEKAKRRFGWRESATNGHKWSCWKCHGLDHAYGAGNDKPCPKKER